MNILITIIIAILGIPAALIAYIYACEAIVSIGGTGERARSWLGHLPSLLRHWLWLFPALLLLGVGLVYPVASTVVLSFKNSDSTQFVGFANYLKIFTDDSMLVVLRNNLLWLVLFTAGTLLFGLLIAVFSDRISGESAVKAMIFVPMAISFVAAGIIWSLVFAYMPQGEKQIGILNATLLVLNPKAQPQAWLSNIGSNNLALIAVGIWMWTGFSMVILSAGLKAIPVELQEAARIDGASEIQLFTRITWPLLLPTIGVVTVTLIMNVLKIFDVVYVMTNGNLGTEVIANRMYKEMFNYHNFGVSSALAVTLLVIMVPFMIYRVREYKKGESHA